MPDFDTALVDTQALVDAAWDTLTHEDVIPEPAPPTDEDAFIPDDAPQPLHDLHAALQTGVVDE